MVDDDVYESIMQFLDYRITEIMFINGYGDRLPKRCVNLSDEEVVIFKLKFDNKRFVLMQTNEYIKKFNVSRVGNLR